MTPGSSTQISLTPGCRLLNRSQHMCSRLRVIAHRRRNVGGAGNPDRARNRGRKTSSSWGPGTPSRSISWPWELAPFDANSSCSARRAATSARPRVLSSRSRSAAGARVAAFRWRGPPGRRPSGGGTSPGAAPPRPDWSSVRAEGMGFPTSTARPAARALASAVPVATADAGTCVLTARHLSRARCSADDRLPLRDHLLARGGGDRPGHALELAVRRAAGGGRLGRGLSPTLMAADPPTARWGR